jgi:hypothetical protein
VDIPDKENRLGVGMLTSSSPSPNGKHNPKCEPGFISLPKRNDIPHPDRRWVVERINLSFRLQICDIADVVVDVCQSHFDSTEDVAQELAVYLFLATQNAERENERSRDKSEFVHSFLYSGSVKKSTTRF